MRWPLSIPLMEEAVTVLDPKSVSVGKCMCMMILTRCLRGDVPYLVMHKILYFEADEIRPDQVYMCLYVHYMCKYVH